MRREDLQDLAAFNAVAREGGFARAARRLGVSGSALSHAISGLEERLGVRLLNRTTRQVSPTEAGRRLIGELEPALAAIAGAIDGLCDYRDRPMGRVRINAHRSAAIHWITPRLAALKREQPGVVIDLMVDQGLANIVADGFDAGVRPGRRVAKEMLAVRIALDTRSVIVASPRYLEQHRAPETPRDLQSHDLLQFRATASSEPHRWRLANQGHTLTIEVDPCFVTNDVDLMIAAAANGLGLAYVLHSQVEDFLRLGTLLTVLEDWSVPIIGDFLYYPSRRQMAPALRAVINALRWTHSYADDVQLPG